MQLTVIPDSVDRIWLVRDTQRQLVGCYSARAEARAAKRSVPGSTLEYRTLGGTVRDIKS